VPLRIIRYNIVEKVLDVELYNSAYTGFKMGAYKTCLGTWVAEHAIVYQPSLDALQGTPLLRINSACFTGDIFGDRRCDCTEQLHSALNMLKHDVGIVIYHFHHEGRGLGITSKLSTYKRMAEDGISTFTAMSSLTNVNDLRSYGSAVLILNDLGIRRVRLITNNPNKKFVLEKNGIEVVETIGTIVTRPDVRQYLETKRDEQGHFIDFDVKPNPDLLKSIGVST
jgi:3,4-dihydroxy 2-butanone 4-phosphate synthase/GTP cyclohydrolase II